MMKLGTQLQQTGKNGEMTTKRGREKKYLKDQIAVGGFVSQLVVILPFVVIPPSARGFRFS